MPDEKPRRNAVTILPGDRYGKLVIEKRIDGTNPHLQTFECKCDCGNVVPVDIGKLRHSTTPKRSCGKCIWEPGEYERMKDVRPPERPVNWSPSPPKKYAPYPKDAIPSRFKNAGPTPREREEDRKIQEAAQLIQYQRQLELAELYGKSLRRFLKASWQVLSPGNKFEDNWHLDCLATHLEAMFERKIKRLIINLPPRSLKSLLVSVAAPAWRWINNPEERFLCASYSRNLSMEFSRKTRNLIMSPWYQLRWKEKFKLSDDQNEKGFFANDKGGERIAASVEGGVLGKGGTCLHGDTYVTTERGDVSIREIVENRMPIRVLSSSGRWRRIKGWSKIPNLGKAVRLSYGSRSLICTDEHPIFIEEKGFISAVDVLESFYGWQIQRSDRKVFLRGLRQEIRKEQSSCWESKTSVLLARVPGNILFRPEQSRLEGRAYRKNVRDLRERIQDEDWPGRTRSLFSCLRRDKSLEQARKASAQTMSILWRNFSATTCKENVLLSSLCQLRTSGKDSWRRERTLQSGRLVEPVRAGLFRNPATGHQGSRRKKMRDLRKVSYSAYAPHRRIENQSRPNQSRDSLYLLSSNGTHEAGYQERLDETVRLDHASRCEAPDYVYNISVETDEDYYANGILVHNCAIYDDPNDLNEMQSPVYRQSVKDWYSGTASSRFIDPQTDIRICVQQRASYGDDLTSYLMELGGWEVLRIPMEWTGHRYTSSIGWEDPRTHIGELMHPARFGPLEIQQLKIEQRQNWQGQFQQEPIGNSTDTLRREWFRFYNPLGVEHRDEKEEVIPVTVGLADGKTLKITPIELPPAFEQVIQSIDCAFKNAEHNDFVAAHVWGRLGANSFLLAREHGHMSFTETKAMVQSLSRIYPCPEKLIEDKANGTAIIDSLRNEVPGLVPVEPYGSKWSRVAAISGYVEAGNVYLPNPDLFPWVWDLLKEFADGQSAKHDDDTDAMSQALKRLYDTIAQSGLPEFRVQPRLGEPQTACHIARDLVPAQWRRLVAVMPGQAALWFSETPTGSLRVLRELSLDRLDAEKAGREIGRLSLPDCLARMNQMRDVKKQVYELYFPKEAFAAVEPVGSYAEMLEKAVLSFEPEAPDYDARLRSQEALRAAHFRSDMVEEQEASLDRLRGLLAFQPPEFKPIAYDRKKALSLADQDIQQYADYMSACEGEVRGEWPKLKIDPECKQLIAELGTFRRDRPGEVPPFVAALLLGVCCPRQSKPREVVEAPFPVGQQRGFRNLPLMRRKFAFR